MNARRVAAIHRELAALHAELAEAYEQPEARRERHRKVKPPAELPSAEAVDRARRAARKAGVAA